MIQSRKQLVGAIVAAAALAWIVACGHHGHGSDAGGGGTGVEGGTTFTGNLADDGAQQLAGVEVCVDGVTPSACADTDTLGTFSVAADVEGQVLLDFAFTAFQGTLCLAGVPAGATVTLGDVLCSAATTLCVPASLSAIPAPAEPITVCNDGDGDGVPDVEDQCPGTVGDAVVNADGCSIDQLAPCAGPAAGGTWSSHQDYVEAVAAAARPFADAGLITEDDRAAIVSAAEASACGEPEPTPTPTPTPTATEPPVDDTPTPTPTPVSPGDEDGDGVSNDLDQCPHTVPGDVVDASGCSVAQLVPCSGPATGGTWRNHGEYVATIADVTRVFVDAGRMTQTAREAIISDAADGNCGKSGDPDEEPTPTPTPNPGPSDDDGDGVKNNSDLCPGTTPGDVVDANGCSVSQLVPCDGDWRNHGQYVAAVADVSRIFVDAGLMTHEIRSDVVREAAHSDCGRGGAR